MEAPLADTSDPKGSVPGYGSPAAATQETAPGSRRAPRHLKISGAAPALSFERCEDAGCRVGLDGLGTSCGRLACPACGCSGTNLSVFGPIGPERQLDVHCSCGYRWVHRELVARPVVVA